MTQARRSTDACPLSRPLKLQKTRLEEDARAGPKAFGLLGNAPILASPQSIQPLTINGGLPLPNELLLQFFAARLTDHRGGREALLPDLKALCLVSRVSRESCQREIFRVVILQPPVWEDYDLEVRSPPNMIPNFFDVVSNNPTLGSYVRRLVYRLPTRTFKCISDMGAYDASKALVTISSIDDLSIEVGGEWESDFLLWGDRIQSMDSAHRRAILGIMRQSTIKSLAVRNLTLSSKDFAFSPVLENLSLFNLSFELPMALGMPNPRNPGIPQLSPRYLTICGESTPMYFQSMRDAEITTGVSLLPLYLRTVETLVLIDNRETVGWRVLQHVHNLKHLHLRTEVPMDSAWTFNTSAIDPLSPRCFSSLTVLSFEIALYMPRGNTPILDPYQGLFLDRALVMGLTSLEELNINITVQACMLGYDPEEASFDGRWSALDETVAPQGGHRPFPWLKQVTLFVLISMNDHEWYATFARLFQERVLDRQFPGLRDMEEAGEVALTLDIDNWG